MPIKPENEKLYPGGSTKSPEWKALRAAVLERAKDKCEACGAPNHVGVYRWKDLWQTFDQAEDTGEAYWKWPDEEVRFVKIVLTISHLDHNPQNNDMGNLRALCQKCHLAHDKDLHQRNAAATRDRKRGMEDLFVEASA